MAIVHIRNSLPVGALVANIAAWIACVGALVNDGATHWPLRVAVASAGAVALAAALHPDRRRLLLSPLAFIGTIVVVFYVTGPAVFMSVADNEMLKEYVKPVIATAARGYLAGPAELAVLQFAAMCFVILSAIATFRPGAPVATPAAAIAARETHAAMAAFCMIATVALALCLRRATGIGDGPGWLAREVHHAVAPLMAVSFTILCRAVRLAPGRLGPMALAGAVLVFAGLLTSNAIKAPIYTVAAGGLCAIVLARTKLRTVVLIATFGAVVFTLAIILLGFFRGTFVLRWDSGDLSITRTAHVASVSALLGRTILHKTVARQTESVGCLHNVFRVHLGANAQPATASPFYFLAAPVPRLLWPAKPSLSLGDQYGYAYCGMTPADVVPGQSHSLSITLLGEPVAQSGMTGLVVAQVTIALILAVASLALFSHRAAIQTGAVALLPWLIDFDQSFALYFANTIKMLVIMLPVLAGLHLYLRRAEEQRK